MALERRSQLVERRNHPILEYCAFVCIVFDTHSVYICRKQIPKVPQVDQTPRGPRGESEVGVE